ncbi:MAG: hypothetical protein EOM84_00320 [Sphingobacteriia bacterium]|nr:hypothetical protein [Sphingobacteriia bacterium]
MVVIFYRFPRYTGSSGEFTVAKGKLNIFETTVEHFLAPVMEYMRDATVSEIMINKNNLFRGKVELEVRILSGPITEKNPSLSEIALVIFGGFLLGTLFRIFYLYFSYGYFFAGIREEDDYLGSLGQIK